MSNMWTSPQNQTSDPEKAQVISQNVEMYSDSPTQQNKYVPMNGASIITTKYATTHFCCCSYPTPNVAKCVAILCLILGWYDIGLTASASGLKSIIHIIIFLPVMICLFYGVFKSSYAFTIPFIVVKIFGIIIRILIIITSVIILLNFQYFYQELGVKDLDMSPEGRLSLLNFI
ncbi:hypothetical protein AB6A40_004016 [Gnathostoma spinigerum]|uniref:Amino acid transporter transmembrane domain-containing protein n=1 Tax=Gnathostoma spinigerum TaxID=75299 RepID=A0ABD6EDF7_9BILA